MKIKKYVAFILATFLCVAMLSACGHKGCPPHDYQIESRVEATCTKQGSITYKCAKCGDEYTSATDIDPKNHRPGPEATADSPQVCLDCGAVLHEPLPPTTVVSARSLAINHYAGVATSYCTTTIDTQVHSKYSLPVQMFYGTPSKLSAFNLNVNIPIQEFYWHDILSVYRLGTDDGKTFSTPGGFKVKFGINTIQNADVRSLAAASNGDFLDNYSNESALKIVRFYDTDSSPGLGFGGIYEVVDFSDSYIEVAKVGDEAQTQRVELWNDKEGVAKTDIEISADNSQLFSEEGTYRIMFKYNIAWVTNPSHAFYDEDGNACYPYGLINDQYDYFYVTITDEKDGVLIPDDFGAEDELFYQLRVDALNASADELYLSPHRTITFGDQIAFHIDTALERKDSDFEFKGATLNEFKLSIYYYDYDSDTGIAGTDPYLLFEGIDLLAELREMGGDENMGFELILRKDVRLRGRSCKMIMTGSFFDESTFQNVTTQQTYVFTFDWE